MENTETSQAPQEHCASSSTDVDSAKTASELNKTFNKVSSVHKNTDFKQTAKYKDKESYASQHHHSIGTGLYLTDDVLDLPPRFRNKVIHAVESLAAANNIPLNKNPLEYVKSFSGSSSEDRTTDPLVCLPPSSKNEGKFTIERISKSTVGRNSNSEGSSNPHNFSESNTATNVFQQERVSNHSANAAEHPVNSHNFSKNKRRFNSESQISRSSENNDHYKDHSFNNEKKFIPHGSSTHSNPCVLDEPSFCSEASSLQLNKNADHLVFYGTKQYEKPYNKHKSNSFRGSSSTINSVESYKPEFNGSDRDSMQSTPPNLLPLLFPGLKLTESKDSGKVISSAKKGDNSHLRKSFENSVPKDTASQSELSQACANNANNGFVVNNVYINSNCNERTNKTHSVEDKYSDREKNSQSSLNSQPKSTPINSFSPNRRKYDRNAMGKDKHIESQLKKVPPDIVSSAAGSCEKYSSRTFYGSQDAPGSINPVKSKFSNLNETDQKDFSRNEKGGNHRNYEKKRNFKSYPDRKQILHSDIESNSDMSLPKGRKSHDNLSVQSTPVHRRHRDSISSVASSHSSLKSNNDKNDIAHQEELSRKVSDNTRVCRTFENIDSSSNSTLHPYKNPVNKQFDKGRTPNKNLKRSNSKFSDTSSIISDATERTQINSDCDNLSLQKNSKHSRAECYKKSSDIYSNKRRKNFVEKYDNSERDSEKRDSYSSKENLKMKINDNRLQQSNSGKECKFMSDRSNSEEVKGFKQSRKYNSRNSNSVDQMGHQVSEHRSNGCVEEGFFIRVQVFEETRNLEYWLKFFRNVFSHHFELERCCHFSDMLILSFERIEHVKQSFKILCRQRQTMRNSQNPHILDVSKPTYRLVKPCSCMETVINDCIAYIEKHFKSSKSVVYDKISEMENSEYSGRKHPKAKTSIAENHTFDDSKRNFTFFKKNILKDVENADNLKVIQQLKCAFIRECNAFMRCLPIYSKKKDILWSVKIHSVSVIVAETGSGKSTQLAQYLQHTDLGERGRIICTQPRKLAAISIAQYVSGQIGSAVGKVVGYDVGVEKKYSELTKIIYMTDHCLLKYFLKNKYLKGISCVIIDEAHERSLYTDLILGMLKQSLEFRPDMRVVITSATINPKIFVDYFKMPERCVIEVPGRSYPVDVIWYPQVVELGWNYVKACVRKAYEIHVRNREGDILVFLTSPSESDEAIYMFKQLLSSKDEKPQLLCLHGKTDVQEQMQIFQNNKRTSRKIVFATNVAETAVTIPGIRFVVDSGMSKELMFDPKKNKSYLAITFINKSAAEQRKGRAGRTQSGVCYRMYSEKNYAEDMVDNSVPEILKTNLQKALLKIFELGIDPKNFDFIETPPGRTISNSVDSLEYLGAIENKKITKFGKRISKLPLEPQLSKFVLQGVKAGIGYETIIIAAVLSESGKLFIRNEDNRTLADKQKRKFCQEGGDLCTFLEIYKRWQEIEWPQKFKWCVENYLSSKALNAANKTVSDIVFSLRNDLEMQISKRYNHSLFKEQFEEILFDSFSENLCVSSGHPKLGYLSPYLPESFFIHPSSTVSYLGKDLPEFLVYNTLMETSRNYLFDVTPISEATIKKASKTGSFQLPLHSLKLLQIPPKVLGPFGESILIRHILGKQGSKIKLLEAKILELTKAKDAYVNVEVDKGLITIYLGQRFHEKVSNHIHQIIEEAHTEMLKEEDVVKLAGTPLHFALGAGGLISDVIMPGEYRELVFTFAHKKDTSDLEKLLKSYGCLQSVHNITTKKEFQICAVYKNVSDAQRAFSELNKKNYYIMSPKPYLPNVGDKMLPLHVLNISWCCRPSTGSGFVDFFSEEDLIMASSTLTSESFYLDNKLVMFTPSENSSRSLKMKNLPKLVEESTIRANLRKCLPKDVEVKSITISRESKKLSDEDMKNAKQKLSKLISQYILPSKFTIEMKCPKNELRWNASVYFDCSGDAEDTFMKLKNGAVIDSYPLSVTQVCKSVMYCEKGVYNAVSSYIHPILEEEKAKGVCVDFGIIVKKGSSKLGVEFSCVNLEQLSKTRKTLMHFLQGEPMDLIGSPKYHFLFSESHMEKIEHVQKSTETFISLNKFRKVITIYGPSSNCQKAKESIYSLASNPDYSYTRTFNLKASCIPFGFLKKVYTKYGYDLHGLVDEFKLTVASIDNSGGTLTLKGLKTEIKKAEQTLEKFCDELFKSNGEPQKTKDVEELCPICFDPVTYDFQRLEHCGHAFCRQCLVLQLESKTMPLVCVKQNCGKLIFLEDIKRIIEFQGGQLKKEFCEVALRHHVSINVGKLSYCPTPDCQMIYRVTEMGSEYNCHSCRNSTCTHCQLPYHYGMSCEMFQNCQKDEDYAVKAWMKENESSCKYCPSCKVVIEKESGCNHMECLNCKVHFCWLCLEIFPTGNEVYKHFPYCPQNQ